MKVLERQIQKINLDKWAELEANEAKWDEVEAGFSFPPKRRYRALAASGDINTLIIEREWPSMAAMEAAYEKAFADPDYQQLVAMGAGISTGTHFELYTVLE